MICAHLHCTLSQNLDNVIKKKKNKFGHVHIKHLDIVCDGDVHKSLP